MDVTPSLYADLERRARQLLRERGFRDDPETLSLVNRACMKLAKGQPRQFDTRAEYLAYSAKTMRSVLSNLARHRCAQRRGGGKRDSPLEAGAEAGSTSHDASERILDVHEKLDKLHDLDPRLARLVELRFFGDLTWKEVAEVLGSKPDVVEHEWNFARRWLRGELAEES